VRVTALEDFDQAIEASHRALDEIAKGDPSAFFELYSDREDATLANPFGPPARGRREIEAAGRRAGSNYRDGRAVEFEDRPPGRPRGSPCISHPDPRVNPIAGGRAGAPGSA
jgi:hypothetical protein